MPTFLGEDDSVACAVVVNDKGQYSIWPQERAIPDGWRATGVSGPRDACLENIASVWPEPTAAT